MDTAQLLDVVERLHIAAEHPDIVEIKRYGRDANPGGQSPAGVSITYQSGSQAYIWAAEPGTPKPEPEPLPEQMPERKTRALHALKFLVELLDTAQPEAFTAWRTVGFADVWLKPAGLALRCTDGTTAYLRVTAGFGGNAALDAKEHPDYMVPLAVKNAAGVAHE